MVNILKKNVPSIDSKEDDCRLCRIETLISSSDTVENQLKVATDTWVCLNFPVPDNTRFADKSLSFKPDWFEYLVNGVFKSYGYEKKVKDMLNMPLTKEMFKEHSLFLLKTHLELLAPYNKLTKQLLEKLYALKILEYNFKRFINAQESGGLYDDMPNYDTALQEIKNGQKKTHWIWYVFPQMKGLGKSELSKFYGIDGREEAKAYIEHPILRERLIEATQAVLDNEKDAYKIFGSDIIKFRACMLLFASISDIPLFKQVVEKYKWK